MRGSCVRGLIVALTLASVPAMLAAQQLVSANGLDIVSIDPVTGSMTVLGRPARRPCCDGVSPYDLAGRRLFYFSAPPLASTDRLVTFNVATRIASETVVQGVVPYFAEYDPASGRVLVPSDNLTDLLSIEPTTGTAVIVGPLPLPVTALSQGESTYDAAGRRLFYLGITRSDPSTPRLATFNVVAGTGSEVPVSGPVFGFIEYDMATRRVLASRGPELISIDPATGASSVIGLLPVRASLGSTYDPVNRRLFYLGDSTSAEGRTLGMFDLATGRSSQVPVPGASIFVEYDAVHAAVPALQSFLLIFLLAVLVIIGLSASR